jgi:rhodanese-related sulfurtransferase
MVSLEVGLSAFASEHAGGAMVIDVREPHEYVAGHVPGARLVPLASLPAHAGSLRPGGPVYVICASGNRSLAAARFLAGRGIDAKSVAGGTSGWTGLGLPVIRGRQEGAA